MALFGVAIVGVGGAEGVPSRLSELAAERSELRNKISLVSTIGSQ